ncbi:MFS transporter [Sphingomonas sp. Leaf357]|uniref:MFS transporter n=1 Tax=Sphingomonas sp. Leaf357 TaxID=1736350 RepID=UPI001F017731|nr:MFS transporter [Sphingomonas sp. Leaf357]
MSDPAQREIDMPTPPAQVPFYGWRMVGLAFLTYNLGLTVVINAFGPALPVLQRELGLSRAAASLPFGVLLLAMGVMAPFVGNLTQRFKLRTLMMTGSACHALGFALLAFATTLPQVLLLFAVMIGAGCCLMAIISAPTLISRWFERDRGKALGFGLVQVFGIAAAPLAAWLVSQGGRQLLFLCLAGLFAAMIPVMRFAIEFPEDVGQQPRRDAEQPVVAVAVQPLLGNRAIFTDPAFWLISLAIGIVSAAGTAFTAHGPAMAAANGISPTLASTMLSGAGIGALFGALLYGWLIDRIGPFHALVLVLLQAAATWFLFSLVTSPGPMILVSVLLGAAMGPAITLHSACINERYGAASFSRVIGYSYFTKIPFMFGSAPLAGKLFDMSGSYASTYVVMIAALLLAGGAAIMLSMPRNSRRIGTLATSPVL